jgi:hypothetical protein
MSWRKVVHGGLLIYQHEHELLECPRSIYTFGTAVLYMSACASLCKRQPTIIHLRQYILGQDASYHYVHLVMVIIGAHVDKVTVQD